VHRISWTRLYINGENMGVYNNLEQVSNSYLHQRFHTTKQLPDSTIYKCDDKAYFTVDTLQMCSLDQGNESAWSNLRELARVFTESRDEDFPAALERVFDVPLFIKAAAVEMAVLRRDGYFDDGSNYMMWLNPATRKWTYISWDFEINMNAPLNVPMFNKGWSFFKTPFMHTTVLPPYIKEIPLTRVLQVPDWNSQYRQFAKETADLMSSPAMDARLAYLHNLLRPHVEKDPYYSLDEGYGVDDFDRAFDGTVRMKPKYSIGRILEEKGIDLRIPDFHAPEFLNLEIKGIRTFMKERAWIVREQLNPTCTRTIATCEGTLSRASCELRGRANVPPSEQIPFINQASRSTCVSGKCICKPGLCSSLMGCEYHEPPSKL